MSEIPKPTPVDVPSAVLFTATKVVEKATIFSQALQTNPKRFHSKIIGQSKRYQLGATDWYFSYGKSFLQAPSGEIITQVEITPSEIFVSRLGTEKSARLEVIDHHKIVVSKNSAPELGVQWILVALLSLFTALSVTEQ